MKRVSLAILGLCAAAFAADNLANWTKFKSITINTKASGANLVAGVGKFPVLVRLDSTSASDVFAQALTGGADLRFSNATGVQMPYQIESWNATAKTASIWVLADTIKANDSSAVLKMYWGRVGAVSASNGAAVFDTANGFRAVWHMNGTTDESDATINGITMTAVGTPTSVAGAVGGARMLDSNAVTRQYFTAANTAANPATNIGSTSPLTLSAWVYSKGFNSATNGYGNSIVNKGDRQYCMQSYGNPAGTAKRWESTVFAASNGWRETIADKVVPDTAIWHLVTGTWSGGTGGNNMTGRFYVDGVKQRDTSLATAATSGQTQTFDVFIGANPNGSGSGSAAPNTVSNQVRPWHGYLDEVSISAAQRDSNWVALSFATQKPTASVVKLGTTQAIPAVALTKFAYTDTLKAADTLTFSTGVAASVTPLVLGGPVDSFKVVGNTVTLPAGITLNKLTGALEGTATAVFAVGNRTIRVYGHAIAGDSLTRTVRVSAVAGPLILVKYSSDTATYTVGVPALNNPVLSASGRAATNFVVSPALPAGLKIDSATGVISGTPSAAVAAANYTVKAMNATDTSSHAVRISVTGTAEVYTTWSKHRSIYLNTGNNSNGVKITGTVTNFPVLIRIASTDTVMTQALAGGADIRFSKSDDATALPYQIERWDTAAATKSAVIWVLVDSVKANSTTQTIRMHWGKAGSTSLSSGSTTFGTNSGFQAVWHMTGGTGDESDATINGLTTTAMNAPADSAGLIGRARSLDGSSQYFQALNTASGPLNFPLTASYTLSAWAKPRAITTTANDGHKIIDKGDNQYVLAVYGTAADAHYWEITTRGNNAYNQCTSNGTTPLTAEAGIGSWHHIVGVYQGAAVGGAIAESLYVDGVLSNVWAGTNTNNTGRVETFNVSLGVQAATTAPTGSAFTRYWNGLLDEVRIASKTRSTDWVALEYGNQKSAQNLVSFTPPTAIAGQAAVRANGLAMSVKPGLNGMLFSIQGMNAGDKAVLSLVDMWGRTVFNSAFSGQNLVWNGLSNNGQSVSAGIYIARIRVIDANGASKVLESRVPFTR